MMKDLPETERPREKLLAKGAPVLSESELLAILLRTGRKHTSVQRLAEELIAKYGLSGLGGVSPRELSKFPGIGLAKAVTVIAGIELGKRLSCQAPQERIIVRCPQDAVNAVMPRLRYETKEHFMVIMLSTKNHILALPIISTGSLNASVVDPRDLFREAINHNAAGIILVHNHPSGDPTPSQEDIALTRKLVDGGKLLDVSVHDHIIIGDGKYVSLREKGII
jgi:DNA repair protein RadC